MPEGPQPQNLAPRSAKLTPSSAPVFQSTKNPIPTPSHRPPISNTAAPIPFPATPKYIRPPRQPSAPTQSKTLDSQLSDRIKRQSTEVLKLVILRASEKMPEGPQPQEFATNPVGCPNSRPIDRVRRVRFPNHRLDQPRSRRHFLQSRRHLLEKILRHIFRRRIHGLERFQIVLKLVIDLRYDSAQRMLHVRKIHQQPDSVELRPFDRHLHAIIMPMHVLALPLIPAQRVARRKRLFHTYSKHYFPFSMKKNYHFERNKPTLLLFRFLLRNRSA